MDQLAEGVQQKETGDQHCDRHPEVNVGKNARERALLWRDVRGHTGLSENGRGYARTNRAGNPSRNRVRLGKWNFAGL